MADKGFISLLVGLFAVSVGILHLFQSTQPQAYMDEIFHIPQAQKYCSYKFSEWDPKITTLPGLYLVSFALSHGMSVISRVNVSLLCSVWWLRAINVLFMIGNAWILHRILSQIHNPQEAEPDKQPMKKGNRIDCRMEIKLTALTLSTFPLLYFFTFLYYTDAGSTFFVLLMYHLSLSNHHIPGALAGVVSTIFRQTNIIWVVFVAGTTAVRHLKPLMPKHATGTIAEIPYFIQAFINNFFLMFKVLFSYGLVVVSFVVFVVMNGGIVVGDKSYHVACLNVPQMFYFVAFSAAFSSPLLLETVFQVYKSAKTTLSLCAFAVALVISLIIVNKFTYVHEYLVADNRHYPFHMWRKIFGRHWSVRYLFTPCYLIAGWLLSCKLSAKQSVAWQLVYWACVSLVLVPQRLLEFRYFILSYILYRVHVPVSNHVALFAELALYSTVNAVTIYMFLNKPFQREHEPNQIHRFMW